MSAKRRTLGNGAVRDGQKKNTPCLFQGEPIATRYGQAAARWWRDHCHEGGLGDKYPLSTDDRHLTAKGLPHGGSAATDADLRQQWRLDRYLRTVESQ